MAKFCYAELAGWIAITLFLRLLAVITAQPGFLSIDCGAKTNYTDENNISWVTDANYIDVGETALTGITSNQIIFSTLRFFPKPLNKSCYEFPVTPSVPYLVRLSFAMGNYSGNQNYPTFDFSIETPGMLAVSKVTVTSTDPFFDEGIFVSSGKVLYVCLIRTSNSEDPFVNGIELRALRDGMYGQSKPGSMLSLSGRYRAGIANSLIIRYPQDNFDRIWKVLVFSNSQDVQYISSQEPISTNNTEDLPPTAVMQSGWLQISSNPNQFNIPTSPGRKSLLLLYFADFQTPNMSESRSFYVSINGQTQPGIITLVRNYSAIERQFISNSTDSFEFHLVKGPGSTLAPIINAYEYYFITDTQPGTYAQDFEALEAIKSRFDIKDWISDPCFLIKWKGIGCDNGSPAVRILQIDLSGWNLSGPVPENIVQMTELVNVSLDNNSFIAPLPNFSNLTKLERLHLQNNKLTGSIPDSLSELKNLKELFIENNNFSGIIPEQLLLNPSLEIRYYGNPYLCMHKGECIIPNSNRNNTRVIVGVTLSVVMIIALALTVGTIVRCKKLRRKEGLGVENSREMKDMPTVGSDDGKEMKHMMYQDYSMITVPNPTKSRAFTLSEMIAATENFGRKIGEGGFGSVFFGQLPEGKDIAVKLLSSFSNHGVDQFLNEVNLLSRINHRNLVSLLGYCNESRELMLIYDHMSGGSLKDRLYGPNAKRSNLNWKTRLKIALDAGQGLEYLHMGCTPKIIHRDVKSANILLDSNLNGILGDFGISRMTMEGDDSHITTAVKGTAGYLDPAYFRTQMLTDKSDVYSFGVVLLEIISGRKAIDVKVGGEKRNLVRWVRPYLENEENSGKITEIIDKRLSGNYEMKSITRVANLAIRCVQRDPCFRPTAREVVAELKETLEEIT